jgi:hypothetical protein
MRARRARSPCQGESTRYTCGFAVYFWKMKKEDLNVRGIPVDVNNELWIHSDYLQYREEVERILFSI